MIFPHFIFCGSLNPFQSPQTSDLFVSFYKVEPFKLFAEYFPAVPLIDNLLASGTGKPLSKPVPMLDFPSTIDYLQ